MGYIYTYGYIPGIIREHGIRLSAITQLKIDKNSVFGLPAVNFLPRGLSSASQLANWLAIRNDCLTKVTADYAIPIFIGDLSIGGSIFSIKRMILTPHFDYSFIGNGGLWSAGTDLVLDMHSILTLEWPCTLGITFSYNGGKSLKILELDSGLEINRFHIGPTFNVTF